MQILLAALFGFFLDLCLGDPRWIPHPVVYIGKLIVLLERLLRSLLPATRKGERIGGTVLVVLVLAITGGVSFGLLWLFHWMHPILGFLLQTFWCYQILATRCLRNESKNVQSALERGTLDEARTAVSVLVGRDTAQLSAEGVTKATIETVAENTTDGVIAPLLCLMLGGAGLGMLYKAVNTMDSMIGYKNDRYQYFGTAAARLDDAANFLPARLSAGLMIKAAWLCGLDWKGAWRIWRRDRRKHKSPNSAQTESACAGALGVQLAGDASYFGSIVQKPAIGDGLRPTQPQDITQTCRLLYAAAILALCLFALLRAAAVWLF